MLTSMKKTIKKMEKERVISKYIPILFLDDEAELENYKHLIGPDTVVIIDDISMDGVLQ